MVLEEEIHGVCDDLAVSLFADSRRNHFDERAPNATIKYLIMHYTVDDFNNTMEIFTRAVSENRVSAHYVITKVCLCSFSSVYTV